MFKNQQHFYKDAKKVHDIITPEFVQTLDIKCNQMDVVCNRGRMRKARFAQKVFLTFLAILIDDLIQNNNKFISPTRNWFTVYIREQSQKSKEKIMKSKAYTNVDMIASDFKFYEFVFYSKYLYDKFRNIRIGYIKYKEIVEKVNQGKRYFIK